MWTLRCRLRMGILSSSAYPYMRWWLGILMREGWGIRLMVLAHRSWLICCTWRLMSLSRRCRFGCTWVSSSRSAHRRSQVSVCVASIPSSSSRPFTTSPSSTTPPFHGTRWKRTWMSSFLSRTPLCKVISSISCKGWLLAYWIRMDRSRTRRFTCCSRRYTRLIWTTHMGRIRLLRYWRKWFRRKRYSLMGSSTPNLLNDQWFL